MPAIPATITIARIGSERASTSISSSSCERHEHLARVGQRGAARAATSCRTWACAASEPLCASASAISPGLGCFSLTAPSVARVVPCGLPDVRDCACDEHRLSRLQRENDEGRKFCGECGSALARACPSCGTPNAPAMKFCGECGSALGAQRRPRRRDGPPTAERRLVSVLFADLVGFTTASEDATPRTRASS